MRVNLHPARARHRETATWSLLAVLLVLRFPFFTGLVILFPSSPNWIGATYELGTYIATLALVFLHLGSLPDFHLDALAVVVIVLFKPLETVILASWHSSAPLAFPRWPSIVVWACAAAAAGLLWNKRSLLPRFRPQSLLWLLVGAVVGTATAVALGYPMSFQVDSSQLPRLPPIRFLLPGALVSALYQIGYAAVSEEPLFRGFLWGQLRRRGWRDAWILLLQAALFTVGHVYYLSRLPISFWVVVPVGALVLGLLAWRTRSLCTSMAAHGFINALGRTVGTIFASFRS